MMRPDGLRAGVGVDVPVAAGVGLGVAARSTVGLSVGISVDGCEVAVA